MLQLRQRAKNPCQIRARGCHRVAVLSCYNPAKACYFGILCHSVVTVGVTG